MKRKKQTIRDMQQVASKRGGKCLSSKYINNRTKLLWECEMGHKWEAAPTNIITGTWCPSCLPKLNERICSKIFQQIFNKKFETARPGWLVNSRGNRMELDGYCKELELAFEYHGQQHFSRIPYYHKDKSKFESRQEDDKRKRELCKKKGITLIEVPFTVKPKEFYEYIIKQCKEKGISIPKHKKIDVSIINKYTSEKFKKLMGLCKKKGGQCLSKGYLGSQVSLKFRCKKGHVWNAEPNRIFQGAWCPYCFGMNKTIRDMRDIAKKKGGICLSKKYEKAHKKLKWQCAEGHIWETAATHIIQGHWCPNCAAEEKNKKTKRKIEEMEEIAKENDGECLSSQYINNYTKLKWKCKKGHTWEAKPAHIIKGTWCPYCSGKNKTIEDMRQLARRNRGECLSSKYKNNSTKLEWRCKEGHVWKAIPNNILKGSWCPYCAGRYKTIEDMQNIAKGKGGECLSKKYTNRRTELKWRCKYGHTWSTTLKVIRNGKWCPDCATRNQTK